MSTQYLIYCDIVADADDVEFGAASEKSEHPGLAQDLRTSNEM